MSRPASSSCSSLQSGAVLGFRFLVVTRKMGAGKDGMALSFVELPELMHHLSCSSCSRLLLCCLVRKYCQRAAALLSANPSHVRTIACSRSWTCSVSRAYPSRVLLLLARCDHLLACLSVICAGVHQPIRAGRLFVCLVISAPAKHPPCT